MDRLRHAGTPTQWITHVLKGKGKGAGKIETDCMKYILLQFHFRLQKSCLLRDISFCLDFFCVRGSVKFLLPCSLSVGKGRNSFSVSFIYFLFIYFFYTQRSIIGLKTSSTTISTSKHRNSRLLATQAGIRSFTHCPLAKNFTGPPNPRIQAFGRPRLRTSVTHLAAFINLPRG